MLTDFHNAFQEKVKSLPEELDEAEKLGPDVDFLLRYCYLGVLGQEQRPRMDQREFLKGFRRRYLETLKKADALQFPSLAGVI
jgi:hypothetical protein